MHYCRAASPVVYGGQTPVRRGVQLVLVSAVSAVCTVTASCATEPHDINSDPAAETAPASPPPRATPPIPLASAPRPSAPLGSVVLDKAALRGEGVTKTKGSSPDGCGAKALDGAVRTENHTWRYPTGSKLTQIIADMPRKAARPQCGAPLNLPPQPVETVDAWCDDGCAALVGQGGTVSLLSVRANTRAKSAEAIQRLVPVVATKLKGH